MVVTLFEVSVSKNKFNTETIIKLTPFLTQIFNGKYNAICTE